MAKAIQRDEAKRNRAVFLKREARGDTSLLVRASFLCGDYKAKAVQPTNAKHLEVGHGRGAWRFGSLLTISAFLVDAIWRKPYSEMKQSGIELHFSRERRYKRERREAPPKLKE